MSRSIHQTVTSVFRGKSKTEIDRMIEEDDPDVVELGRKLQFKRRMRNTRALAAIVDAT